MSAPDGLKLPPIPAMTTEAERYCYYRLAKEFASKGTIIELGAWLGASTYAIAAGVRDSGIERKVQVFDFFKSKPGHIRKVKEFYSKEGLDRAPLGPCVEAFLENLGELSAFVEINPGRIEEQIARPWAEDSVSLLVTDAPKRVPAISAVLTALKDAIQLRAPIAWQDFCHFPSYEIPAALYRLREKFIFYEAVVPGTTIVLKVDSRWSAEEVSLEALALDRWNVEEIRAAWSYWLRFVATEKTHLFRCGAAMFMVDIGFPYDGVDTLAEVYRDNADAIVPKWRYLRDNRIDFRTRYAPLFKFLEDQGALAC